MRRTAIDRSATVTPKRPTIRPAPRMDGIWWIDGWESVDLIEDNAGRFYLEQFEGKTAAGVRTSILFETKDDALDALVAGECQWA